MPYIYLVDERIQNPDAVLNNVPESDLGFRIDPYQSVQQIASLIVSGLVSLAPAAPRGRRSIARNAPAAPMISGMRIMAHGDSGELFLGRGVTARNAVELGPLANYMRTGATGHCHLLGC